jgi:HAD superfamily hydrolase (TIGR01549 family)
LSSTLKELGKKYNKELNGKKLIQQSNEEADILDFIQPNPGLQKILSRLYTKFQLDVISSSKYDSAIKKLKRTGIDRDLFGFFLAGETFGSKTEGTLYELWLSKRGILPSQVLYIGDSTKQDIDSPKRLGIKTCIVGKQYENADFYMSSVNDLESLL